MPELPEAEYMVGRLEEYGAGAEIVRSPLGRHTLGRIRRYHRRAKNVLIELETGWTLRVQLGMTGHVYWIPDAKRKPRFTRAAFELKQGGALVFEDARRFGNVSAVRTAKLPEVLNGYGPEPLDRSFRWQQLKAAGARLAQPVKAFLLDQRRIGGLGNIWAAESLFGARIHPARPARTLSDEEWRALHTSIRRTLRRAIANTFKVTARPEEFPETDLQWLAVYGRASEPCRRCRHLVEKSILAGRATYFCRHCQH